MRKMKLEKCVIFAVSVLLGIGVVISLFYFCAFLMKMFSAAIVWKVPPFECLYISVLGILPLVLLSIQWIPPADTYARLVVSLCVIFVQGLCLCALWILIQTSSGYTSAALVVLFSVHIIMAYIVMFFFRSSWRAVILGKYD